MKLTKRILAVIAGLAVTATMFTACENNNAGNDNGSEVTTAPAQSNETVKLTVWGSQEDQEFLEKKCDEFAKANADKKYEFTFGVCSEADAKKTVLTDVSVAADVYAFASDQTAELQAAGALYRITKNKDKIVAANSEASIQAASVDGELYGYPSSADTYFMYYDKSKFTADEVKSLDKMLAKDIDGVTTNFGFDLDNGWYQSAFFFGAGCKLFGEDGTDPTKCDFNNDRGYLVGEYLMNVAKNNKFGTNVDDSLLLSGFKDGTFAAGITGTWNASAIEEILGENYAATKLPSFKLSNGEEVQMGGMANFKLYGVNPSTKAPIDAMALAEFLSNKETQLERFELRSFCPTNIELTNDTKTLGNNIAVSALAEQMKYATLQTSIPQSGNYWAPAEAFGQDIINGAVTSDNLQEKLDAYVSSVLTQLG